MPAFFIESRDIRDRSVTIAGDLLHHLRASLRVQIDETLQFTDEQRRRHHAVVTEVTRERLIARILSSTDGPERRHPELILGQALLKGEHMDWIVQKAGELGIDLIVPLVTRRTVIRPRESRVDAQTTRWQRIAREAAQQSEQWQASVVQPPRKAQEFFEQTKAACRLILAERTQGASLSEIPLPVEPAASVVVAAGPEGGWHADELALARTHGFQTISLGPTILRAETASLATLAILENRLGLLG